MTSERKKLNAKMRKKFGYSTCPTTCRNGTYLYHGELNHETGDLEHYVSMEIGWHKEEKIHIMACGKLPRKGGGRGTTIMTFEEIELLYKLTQELKKEWEEEK